MKRIDDVIRGWHQRAYDALWDRLGLRVGTYRAIVAALIFLPWPLAAWANPYATGAMVAAWSAFAFLSWLLFCEGHLRKERRIQEDGMLDHLNLLALIRSRQGPRVRGLLGAAIPIVVGICLADGTRAGATAALAAILLGLWAWHHSREVLVRRRNAPLDDVEKASREVVGT